MSSPPLLKRAEHLWKRFVFFLIRSRLERVPTPTRLDWTRGHRRVLFLRQDRLGDAIVSTGLLRAITSLSDEIELDVLASPRNADFFRRLPYVRKVHVFDKRNRASFPSLWRELRSGDYDAVIDCMVTAPSLTGLLLMLASRAPVRIGVGGRGVDWGLTHPVGLQGGDGHIIDLYSDFITAFNRAPLDFGWGPEFPLTEEEASWSDEQWQANGNRTRVLLNISAGEPRRAWPDEEYVTVAKRLISKGDLDLVIVGAPTEVSRIDDVAHQSGARPVHTPTIGRVAALVASADLLITPDTSLVHMASAAGTPVVAMYISGTSAQWGPFEVPSSILESSGTDRLDHSGDELISAVDAMIRELPRR